MFNRAPGMCGQVCCMNERVQWPQHSRYTCVRPATRMAKWYVSIGVKSCSSSYRVVSMSNSQSCCGPTTCPNGGIIYTERGGGTAHMCGMHMHVCSSQRLLQPPWSARAGYSKLVTSQYLLQCILYPPSCANMWSPEINIPIPYTQTGLPASFWLTQRGEFEIKDKASDTNL